MQSWRSGLGSESRLASVLVSRAHSHGILDQKLAVTECCLSPLRVDMASLEQIWMRNWRCTCQKFWSLSDSTCR